MLGHESRPKNLTSDSRHRELLSVKVVWDKIFNQFLVIHAFCYKKTINPNDSATYNITNTFPTFRIFSDSPL